MDCKLVTGDDDDSLFEKYSYESVKESGEERQLVPSKYSEFMSYPPRRNNDIAIPMWKFTEQDLKKLGTAYVIAKDVGCAEMKQRIKDLMYPIVDQVLEGKGFVFTIPSKTLEDMEYHSDLCFPLLKRGKQVSRNFHHENSIHSATMTAWALKAIFENLDAELVLTLRDLFYRRSHLFRNQSESDGIITDICVMLECTRRSLNLTSEEKGWVCGKLTIKLKSGRTFDCSDKIHIPDESKISSYTLDPQLEYILVLEKGTIFNYLERLDFHNTRKCIMMTSNGTPDISSRRFLKWLERVTNLPIIGIADADPSGLDIMKNYSQGSVNLAQENFNLAVPSLRWAGISLLDIEDLGIELDEWNSTKLSKKDKKILDRLLSGKYNKLTTNWKMAVEKMRTVDRKASFEVMHQQGYRFVADYLLPMVISRARGVDEQATPPQ